MMRADGSSRIGERRMMMERGLEDCSEVVLASLGSARSSFCHDGSLQSVMRVGVKFPPRWYREPSRLRRSPESRAVRRSRWMTDLLERQKRKPPALPGEPEECPRWQRNREPDRTANHALPQSPSSS